MFQRPEQHERSCKLKRNVILTHNAVRRVTNLLCCDPKQNEELTFSLVAMKLCHSSLRAAPAVATQTFIWLRINTFLYGNPFASPLKDCSPLQHVDFLSRRTFLKFFFKIPQHKHCITIPYLMPSIYK